MLTASTNKSKAPWKIINNETGHAPKNKFFPPELRSGSKKIPISKAAEYFNTYFISSVDKLINQYPKNEGVQFSVRKNLFDKFLPEIVNISITSAEVLSSIFSLKNKTSCGYDGLSNKIIKLCGEQITVPLTYIYNLSLNTGTYPDQLK
jgi:hypothetical protein